MRNEIIPRFATDDQPALVEAADVWRWPYWDWALKRHDTSGAEYDLPQLFYQPTVEVRNPTGTANVDNPFSVFKMPNGVAMGDQKALGKLVIDVDPVSVLLLYVVTLSQRRLKRRTAVSQSRMLLPCSLWHVHP